MTSKYKMPMLCLFTQTFLLQQKQHIMKRIRFMLLVFFYFSTALGAQRPAIEQVANAPTDTRDSVAPFTLGQHDLNDGQANGSSLALRVCVRSWCYEAPLTRWSCTITITHAQLPTVTLQVSEEEPVDEQGCRLIELPALPPPVTIGVTPSKDNDHVNGLDLHDLFLINYYVIGMRSLPLPYGPIAADANNSRSVTTFDIVELRKLLFNNYKKLPSNTSWRFVDADFVFPEIENPFRTLFPENKTITPADTASLLQVLFTAVKIGDVDCTALPDFQPGDDGAPERSALPGNALTVDAQEEFIYRLWPNPTMRDATLWVLLEEDVYHLSVWDARGRLCWETHATATADGLQTIHLPAEAFPAAGAYIWRLTMGKTVLTGKIQRL